MDEVEHERVLAKVKERLGLDVKLVSPCVFEIAKVLPHPVVPVVDGSARYRDRGVVLDARIEARDERLYVVSVELRDQAAMQLHVLLRHRLLPRLGKSYGGCTALFDVVIDRHPYGHPLRPLRDVRFARMDLRATPDRPSGLTIEGKSDSGAE